MTMSVFGKIYDGKWDRDAIDALYVQMYRNNSGARHAPLFLNRLCESSHGMGDAGSFSLLSLRSASIIDSVAAHLKLVASPSGHLSDTFTPAEATAQPVFQ